jgi:hypothetical protein
VLARAAGLRDTVWWPIGWFALGLILATLAVRWGASGELASYYGTPSQFAGSSVVGGWMRWDGGWYAQIAEEGYFFEGTVRQSSVAFFPVYPLLLRSLSAVTSLPVQLTGVIVTTAAGLGASLLFWKWCRMVWGNDVARLATVLLAAYPYALYTYGAVYADAVFLCATLAAFVLLELDHPVWAGLAGAVASASRPVGVAVIVGLVAVTLMRREALWRPVGAVLPRFSPQHLRKTDAGVVLSVVGLGAWMVYLGARFGDPLAFQTVQAAPGWAQASGPRTWIKQAFLDRLHSAPGYVDRWASEGSTADWEQMVYAAGLILHLAVVVACIALLRIVWRRIGWAYVVYAAIVIAIPILGSKDFHGVGRYMLAAFPCIAALSFTLVTRPVTRVAAVVASAVAMVGLAALYGRGYYVA